MRRIALLVTLVGVACGGHPASTPVPQSMSETLDQFLGAVKAKDYTRMGDLWGSERGPASGYMRADYLRQTLQTIQKYLDHKSYRVVEGPVRAQPLNPTYKNVPDLEKLRDFRVELQRDQCNRVIPITLVRTNSGGWLVYDVHLEAAGNPARPCMPPDAGTR
jgi:hypothetical protein